MAEAVCCTLARVAGVAGLAPSQVINRVLNGEVRAYHVHESPRRSKPGTVAAVKDDAKGPLGTTGGPLPRAGTGDREPRTGIARAKKQITD